MDASTYTYGLYGGLAVKFGGKPGMEEAGKIESLANRKISEDASINILSMSRDGAESVLGEIIYDLYPVPGCVKYLTIVVIDDWNINVCNKLHLPSLGGIGYLKIKKYRFRRSKGLLEISFNILECGGDE